MCGIAGILNLKPDAPSIEEKALIRMRDAMTHRGPDGEGLWISANRQVGLAHRRLKIIDLSDAARQPMTNEDGSIHVTFNGEIYNHLALRKKLRQTGHRFVSASDTEVILHAYEEWGMDAIEQIDGMFAFALWDAKKNRLWLARDRMGKKPLYFAKLPDRLIFASEIKALLQDPGLSKTICPQALSQYLTFSVPIAPLTLFEGIHKMPPGTWLTIPERGPWEFREYWRPWHRLDSHPRTFEEYAAEILDLLESSVKHRLMSDVPFGVFLSGGVDSSANVALMSRNMDRPVDTFSVGFKDANQAPYNEIQFARQISERFQTRHHEVLISDDDFFPFAEQMAWQQDEPLSDPVCFPLYHVAKLARQHGTIVIQVGEGSDEIFAGYDIYRNYLKRQNGSWRWFQLLSRANRWRVTRLVGSFLDEKSFMHLQRASDGEHSFLGAAIAFYDPEKELFPEIARGPAAMANWPRMAYGGLNPSFGLLAQLYPDANRHELACNRDDGDFLRKMIWWECHHRLAELLLMRLDKMTMAHGIEARAPFLDTRLVELAYKIPSSMKIRNHQGKAVLKKALEPLLPKELIYRRKIGFCGGSVNMVTPAIQKFARDKVLKKLPELGWNPTVLNRIFDRHQSGAADHSFQIWNLMNLALWQERWL